MLAALSLSSRRVARHAAFRTMANPMSTKLLYQEKGDLYEQEAAIAAIEALPAPGDSQPSSQQQPPDSHVIYLDQTIFHVQGGGQPFDLGTITPLPADNGAANGENTSPFQITSVRNGEDNTVRHAGYFLSPSQSTTLPPTSKVHLSLDVPRRTLNSRLHSAGHILGAAIMSLSRAGTLPPLIETKANHYPDNACVEFTGLIDGKHKQAIQDATDALVREARPLHIRFWSREECVAQNVALPEKIEGGIFRVVEVEGCGSYACGGTHVRDTAGVGRVVVRSIRRQKGGTRVGYFVDEKL